MSNITLPPPIEQYFAAMEVMELEEILACFADDATVSDNGEDAVLMGVGQIADWLRTRISRYKLSSEVRSGETWGEEFVAKVIVSGDFPGSPYEFAYRFKLREKKIAELAIDPIGSLAP